MRISDWSSDVCSSDLIGQRSALLDVDGNPVIDNDGRFVTDKDSPRRLSYDQDGLIWDVGVMWRPSRRTSLEVHAGRRYGSMSYTAAFSYQPSQPTPFQLAVFDVISRFGRNPPHKLP